MFYLSLSARHWSGNVALKFSMGNLKCSNLSWVFVQPLPDNSGRGKLEHQPMEASGINPMRYLSHRSPLVCNTLRRHTLRRRHLLDRSKFAFLDATNGITTVR